VVLPTNTSLNQDTSNPDLTIIITGVKAWKPGVGCGPNI
jgi:hypothetical protein